MTVHWILYTLPLCGASRAPPDEGELFVESIENTTYEVTDRVATITLARPDKANAQSETMLDELDHHFRSQCQHSGTHSVQGGRRKRAQGSLHHAFSKAA